jgi:hypothetical protein
MSRVDSFEKIVTVYFAAMTVEPFEYRGATFSPRRLAVSPLMFRGLSCPPRCGGCCHSMTLDYLPGEAPRECVEITPRQVRFNERVWLLYRHYPRRDGVFCRYLDMEDGRCGIHDVNPFSCSFEIMRFIVSDDAARLMVKTFGRGWAMLRVDGERGARCVITPYSEDVREWQLRQMARLRQWMCYFHLNPQRVDEVTRWIRTGPHTQPLDLPAMDRTLTVEGMT